MRYQNNTDDAIIEEVGLLHFYRNIITEAPINSNLIIMNNLKRYLISSLVTFATGFAMVFVSQIDNISMASLTDGSIVGLLFVAVRAGIKGLLELFIATFATK